MKQLNGFLFVDAMLTFSIISLITVLLIPMLQQMNHHYDEALNNVARHRMLFVELLAGHEVIEYPNQYCSSFQADVCIEKR